MASRTTRARSNRAMSSSRSKGLKAAGADFAADAVGRGAVAVVADRPADTALPVPWVIVPDARVAMAALAAEFYGHPSRSMQVVGITGTNGKTTTAYLLRAVFEAAGKKCGLLGTVAYSVGDRGAARVAHDAGGTGCAADVPADGRRGMWRLRHGGVVARAGAPAGRRHAFAAGVFTNLTRDHLDYHGDMESYFSAKRRLFDMLPAGRTGRHQPGRSSRRVAEENVPRCR